MLVEKKLDLTGVFEGIQKYRGSWMRLVGLLEDLEEKIKPFNIPLKTALRLSNMTSEERTLLIESYEAYKAGKAERHKKK